MKQSKLIAVLLLLSIGTTGCDDNEQCGTTCDEWICEQQDDVLVFNSGVAAELDVICNNGDPDSPTRSDDAARMTLSGTEGEVTIAAGLQGYIVGDPQFQVLERPSGDIVEADISYMDETAEGFEFDMNIHNDRWIDTLDVLVVVVVDCVAVGAPVNVYVESRTRFQWCTLEDHLGTDESSSREVWVGSGGTCYHCDYNC